MPDSVDESKVQAEFKDGVLNVRLRKAEKAKPKASKSRSLDARRSASPEVQ